ncbi:putative Speckle targeted PIP5K1A-regulated poly(A) polymerase [Hypsibius exemplaris]|uniref:Speckle targeted PIP5K1A-regulated poly(A) polymerase n=1 Tax=Hypsibius exemplaris TaxID=2072580 RepID=A0A1W0X868_HYPEX|nr:putative Speckle targeted PIP5K1A-regulated poly(A) polymerase [Hypsibius exemplaris]
MHSTRGPGPQHQAYINSNNSHIFPRPSPPPSWRSFGGPETHQGGLPVRPPNPLPNFANLRVEEEQLRDPNVSDKRLDELRRSFFVPNIPGKVSAEELTAVFRSFGSLQECIVKDTGNHRFAIVIYVEPESAFDVLSEKLFINDALVVCEPRMIGGRSYPPLPPTEDTVAPPLPPPPILTPPGLVRKPRIPRPGIGRGAPFSVVPEQLPVVAGSAYAFNNDAFPALGAATPPRYSGPVATRAPLLPTPALLPTRSLPGKHIPLPMPPTQSVVNPLAQRAAAAAPKSKKPPLRSTELVLHHMPFLGLSVDGLEQMALLVHNVELKEGELLARAHVCSQLEQTFRRVFRNCRMRMYGSSANTFGVRGSDIDAYLDLCLDSPEANQEFPPREKPIKWYYNNITQLQQNPYHPGELKHFTKQEILALMERLMRYLAKLHDWDYIQGIPSARTPILKLHQARSNMRVDISFSSKMVFQNTGLLILYSYLDPRMRPLVYTLRRWAETKELCGDTAFTKYALTMLLVFFLHQTKPAVLPTPEQIVFWMETEKDTPLPGPSGDAPPPGGKFSFDMPVNHIRHIATIIPPSLNKSSPAELLVQFFNFYVDFPFTNHVMCGYTGEVLPVEDFPVPEEGFRFRYVNLQDPFDLAHNIAKSVCLTTFISFREFLRQEVAVFTRMPLNLLVLFNIDHAAADLPDYPVMISISPSRSLKELDDEFGQKVAGLTAKMLMQFFRCEFVREISREEFGSFPFSRAIHPLGPVLVDLHCRLECESWSKRRNIRKQLSKKPELAKLSTPAEEWEMEAAIGNHLHRTTHRQVAFDFYVTLMLNNVESEKVCIFLTCPQKTDPVREFFDILWKFLPEQTRRYLKPAEPPAVKAVVVEAEGKVTTAGPEPVSPSSVDGITTTGNTVNT